MFPAKPNFKLVVVALLVLSGSASHAQENLNLLDPSVEQSASERSSSDESLQLFMSAGEQSSLENKPALINPERNVEDSPSIVSKPEVVSVIVPVVEKRRFDGVVLKRDQVMGMWIDRHRVSHQAFLSENGVTHVDRSGRMRLGKSSALQTIAVGDYIASARGADIGVTKEAASDIASSDNAIGASNFVAADREDNSTDEIQ